MFCYFWFLFVLWSVHQPLCTGTANVLQVLDEAEISEERIFETAVECDPASTCEMRCPCGKSLYFDMTKHRGWTSTSTQNIWKSICGTRLSVTHYVSAEIRGAADRLVTRRSGFAGLITNVVQKILMITKISVVLGNVFRMVYTRYKQICHGGAALSRTTLRSLTIVFDHQLYYNAAPFKTHANYGQLKAEAKGIFDRFVARINAGGFKYCNCVPFLSRTSWTKLVAANWACTIHCARSTLEFEENEALAVAADEYFPDA